MTLIKQIYTDFLYIQNGKNQYKSVQSVSSVVNLYPMRNCCVYYSLWYFSPLIIVNARYNCSTKKRRIIWCENVIFDKDNCPFARL